MKWDENEFEFHCMEDYKGMINSIKNNQNHYFLAMGGIPLTTNYIKGNRKNFG